MKKRSEFPKKTVSSTVLVFEGCGVSKQILRGHPGTFVNTVSYQYCPYVKELFSQESLLFLDVCCLKKKMKSHILSIDQHLNSEVNYS